MKHIRLRLAAMAFGMAAALGHAQPVANHASAPQPIRNIVIVPGAFVDASGWRAVHDILVRKGYHVTLQQPRIESLSDDVAGTRELIAHQDGPVLLVGHSYGGMVITQAGNDARVKGLVYVAALEPDAGESLAQLAGSAPAPAPTNDIVAGGDGWLHFDVAHFHADFAADVDTDTATFMADAQVPANAAAFNAKTTDAAWRSKPSWAVLTTDDHALSPELQRRMYLRAGSAITDIRSSHVVYLSHPEAVAAVIEQAAVTAK